jgi:hypothetical protein
MKQRPNDETAASDETAANDITWPLFQRAAYRKTADFNETAAK